MLNSLLKKYIIWSDFKKAEKADAKFMKEAYRREIALTGINLQKIECASCKSNAWGFIEKPAGTEIKLICRTCGLVQYFHYRVLFERLKALKEKRDAEAKNTQPETPAPEAPKTEQPQELPKEDATEKPVEETKE